MKRKKSRKTKLKRLNKKKIIFLFIIIIILLFSFYNNIKKEYKFAETVNYQQANKIDKCIVIDAGHGGVEEPGCIFENVYEKNICLKIAEKLKTKLEREYTQVIMTRTEDVNVYLNERARIANRANADIFVSIHQNALEDDNETSGIETWYNPVKDTESKILAQNIQDNIIETTNANNIGIKDSKGLIVIKNTQMPSCLIETGFLSNKRERENLQNDNYQNKIVEGIYNGIKDFFQQTQDNKTVEGNNV